MEWLIVSVEELNKEQLEQLKQHYYTEKQENVSWEEIININDYVSNEEIIRAYSGINFVEDDFLGG